MKFNDAFYLVAFFIGQLWMMLSVILSKKYLLIPAVVNGILLVVLSLPEKKVKSKRRLKK